MRELFVNGRKVELDDNSIMAMIFQAARVGELDKRFGNISVNFKIPKSNSNINTVNQIDNPRTVTRFPYVVNTVKYVQDGVEVISNGTLDLGEISNTINVNIIGGNMLFFNYIKDKNLPDLPLEELDHTYDYAGVLQRMESDNKIVYPLIDFGAIAIDGSRRVRPDMLRPAVYVKYLIEKLAQVSSFKIEFNFSNRLQEDLFNRMAIPIVSDLNQSDEVRARFRSTAALSQDISVAQFALGRTYKILGLQDTNNSAINEGGGWNTQQSQYEVKEGITMGFEFKGTVSADSLSLGTNIDFIVVLNDGTSEREELTSQPVAIETANQQYPFSIATMPRTFKPGDTICLYWRPIYGTFSTIYAGANIITNFGTSSYGAPISPKLSLPDMKVIDFLKHICNYFCLIPKTDEAARKITFTPFDRVVTNIGFSSKDWSKKLVNPDDYKLTWTLGEYAKKNTLEFKEDSTVPAGYGNGEFAALNNNLNGTYKVYESPFAASEDVSIWDGSITLAKIDRVVIGTNNERAFKNKVEPRIILLEDGTGNIDLFEGATSTSVSNFKVGVFGDMSFQYANTMFYKGIRRILREVKRITHWFYLSPSDVANFDHSIPVYIEQLGHYFYVEKIDRWIAGEKCRVDLIMIPSSTENARATNLTPFTPVYLYKNNNAQLACTFNNGEATPNIYYFRDYMSIGDMLFKEAGFKKADAGTYSNGRHLYVVSSAGVITNISNCS